MPLFEVALHFRYIKNLGKSLIDYFSQIRGLFSTFNVIDAVDILFVAVVLYIVIRILRETRAMQLIKGLLFVAFLYFLVTFLGMSASSYILRAVFSNIIIIIVILFGPEIRNILERMGVGAARNSLRSILSSGVTVELTKVNKLIDAVTKACTDMSDTNTGALIVCEKHTNLGDIIHSGTIVNAEASKELIENIFFPKSPLHDGALVIRDNLICAAGCILPISRDVDIASSFGTRHRAAIGLSEQSDALIIVVSEETGHISVAKGGQLEHDISSGQLRDMLLNHFAPSSSSKKEGFFKKFGRGNKDNV